MGAAKYIRRTFQNEFKGVKDANYDYSAIMRARTIDFRKEDDSVVRLEHPTNLPAAHRVGYKAKQGIIVVRTNVRKGSGTKHRPKNKRRPKRQGKNKLTRRISIQAISEQRASKRFPNMEVLGSYKIAEDGGKHYFEVILADRTASTITTDKELSYLMHNQKGRAERGKTASGRSNVEVNKKNARKNRAKKALDRRHG
jgi:large subunit ribosomal protein L15e